MVQRPDMMGFPVGRPAQRDVAVRRQLPLRAFSLLELIVVMAVTVVLTGLLFPAMKHVRENVHRVVSASNQRQIGLSMAMFYQDNDDELPYSELLNVYRQPQELMAAHVGAADSADDPTTSGWDGLGLLYRWNYLSDPQVFYSPSHGGEHDFVRYEPGWQDQRGTERIYTNYHYGGDTDWETQRRRSLIEGDDIVLLTDGLRTISDLNHENGLNMLYGDLSVRWREGNHWLTDLLPDGWAGTTGADFSGIWGEVERNSK